MPRGAAPVVMASDHRERSPALARLRVCVKSGSNFVRSTDGSACSASCLLRLVPRTSGRTSKESATEAIKVHGGEKANILRTSVKEGMTCPVWNEEFVWTYVSTPEDALLEISAWDSVIGEGCSSTFVGQAVVMVDKLVCDEENTVQLDVLSCHTSLADRSAQLTMSIWLERISTPSPVSDQRPMEENTHTEIHRGIGAMSGGQVNKLELHLKREQLKQQLQLQQRLLTLRQQAISMPSATAAGASRHASQNEELEQIRSAERRDVKHSEHSKAGGPTTIQQETPASPHAGDVASERPGGESGGQTLPETLSTKRAGIPARDAAPAHEEETSATSLLTPSNRAAIDELTDEAKKVVVAHFVRLAPYMKMFQGVDVRLVERLSTLLTVLSCKNDTGIVEAGSEGHSMYFLLRGECSVFVTGKKISTLTSPCTFGEIALLLSERRSADVRTTGQCLICELAQADLWNAINEFPSAANTIYSSLKLQAVHHVTKNKGQMCTVETHPSALQENLDPLSALNLSERRQRILQWHRHYESEDWQGSSQDQNECVDIANGELDPIHAAMKISGASDHVVAIIREMDMFKGAPARAQAQVIAKLVMVKFCKHEVVIQAGTVGTCMYIVDKGRVGINVQNKQVGELGSGQFFGELALLSHEKRTATVVALEDCRLLQLDQNSVWTVVNMFPTMFKTMKDVASKRIDRQETSDQKLTSSRLRRKMHRGAKSCRVKFRALFDRFTPEELGATARTYFVAGMTDVKLALSDSRLMKKDKESPFFFTISDEDDEIYASPYLDIPTESNMMQWQSQEPMKKRFSPNGLHELSFCLYQVAKKGGIAAHLMGHKKCIILGTAKIPVAPVLEVKSRTFQQSLQLLTDTSSSIGASPETSRFKGNRVSPSPSPSKPSKDRTGANKHKSAGAPSVIGMLSVTMQASQDQLESYRLLVPCFNDSHADGQLATVVDFTGKAIVYLKSRSAYDAGDEQSPCRYETIVDIVGLDMTHKGQVATDVTVGSHSRSRLANNSDFHWATVKSKRRKPRKALKGSKAEDEAGRVASGASRHIWDTDHDFHFKVVPTFKELSIVGVPEESSRSKDPHGHHQQRKFTVAIAREEHLSPHVIGDILIGGTSLRNYAVVHVTAGEDAIRVVQVAIGICEANRWAPPLDPNASSTDHFKENYR